VWRVLAKSVVGTSHRRLETECQDSCFTHRMVIGEDECLVIACADGAGSASEGGLGAAVACQAFCQLARDGLSGDLRVAHLDEMRVLQWYRQVRDELAEEASQRNIRLRELACTLLTAVLSPRVGVFAQVGDGAIVVGADGAYQAVTWPTSGEYANETTFITADTFEKAFECVRWQAPISEVALLTDGLQRLALSYANKSVHAPFFTPMFQALLAAEVPDLLSPGLERFLDSPAVNERTDDDKTLVLAVWNGIDGGP
jgi:protein phosphatase 2C-like protein